MVKFLGSVLRPYRKSVIILLLLQIVSNCLSLYLPRINARILDIGVPNLDIQYILGQGGIMLVLALLQLVAGVLASVYGARTALSAGRELRQGMYDKILSLSQKEMATFGAPTLITRATNDVQQVVQFITILFTIIISAPITFFGGIIMAMSLDLPLSTMILCTLPVFILISVLFIRRVLPYYRQQQENVDNANGVLRDQISGERVARAFVKQKWETRRMEDVNKRLSGVNLAIAKTSALMTPLFMVVLNLAGIAVIWFGGVRAEAGQTQVGTIISMVTYASFILSAVMQASIVFLLGPRAEISATRIQEVLNSKSSVPEAAHPVIPENPNGDVRFDDVSFSYAPDDPNVEPVLKHLTFEAKPGKTTAIIGSTGAGKTTLLNLILRLMDATSGEVMVDGQDVRDMSVDALRQAIALVPQKAFLFSGTLAENLRHARPDATDEELWEALRIAQAKDFIKENPDGLDMHVAEGGNNFSGGQKQRLAIARAIVRHPSIYIFDDSFSALDYATDKALRHALKTVTGDAAVIIVGQRISSIADADQIIVLNNGAIEDIGTHEDLLKRCTTYQEIAASQPTSEEEGAA